MTPFEVIDRARRVAAALPDVPYVEHCRRTGYEVLVWHGHEPVVVPPPGPPGLYGALLEAHRRGHPSVRDL